MASEYAELLHYADVADKAGVNFVKVDPDDLRALIAAANRAEELENALALVDSVNPKMGKRYESAWEIARSLLKPHPLTDCPKCGQFRGHGHEEHCPAALAPKEVQS